MKFPEQIDIPVNIQQLITAEVANYYRIIPFAKKDDEISFYVSAAKGLNVKSELEMLLGLKINLLTSSEEFINKSLALYYRTSAYDSEDSTKLKIDNSDFLEKIIFEAKSISSSDIHFEVYNEDARIRLRIDGLLIEKYRIPKENYLELVNKIKIKSNLDITEKRLPQDGRINYADFDIRVSILPTLYGEKIVMRILGKDASEIDIDRLGFELHDKDIYLQSIKNTYGIILISGPTGSGKTTTLYATLKLLNNIKRNIVTVEDPIEYTLRGVNQVQLKENIGLTFTSALRSFLRQDPDVIMLGEIRDAETAQMAIRASLTGHLVLSTIHTNSAMGTISRLIDMGVPSFLIAETLIVSVAQRLVRLLCPDCKRQIPFENIPLPKNFNKNDLNEHFVSVGCEKCHFTGYRGRRAIYEVIPINSDISNAIKADIKNIENKEFLDIKRLADKAFLLFKNGETSLDEIYSILIN